MDDLISRQAAIEALGEEPEVWLDTDVEIAQRAQWRADKAAIEAVPTAEPRRGRWELEEEQKHVELIYSCSECGCIAWGNEEISNYCPNCGARMDEEVNDESDNT